MKKTLTISIITIILLIFVAGIHFYSKTKQPKNQLDQITNFEQCVVAGNAVMESYPRQCRAGERNFVEELKPTLCADERPEICADVYDPVCAKVNVQCIKAPCDPVNQTFPNACRACANPLVESYIAGECLSTEQKNIVVTEPSANATVGLPLNIKGRARVFENTFSYRIRDSDESLLLERHAMADSPDTGLFGDFDLSVNYPKPDGETGTVEVFEYSAKDGSEINKVSVPVIFEPVVAMDVKVFYPNRIKDPNMLDCAKNYEVIRRIPQTQAVARASVMELLLGPDRVESETGYFSNLNSGIVINSLTIQNGIAKVDFNDLLDAGIAGSCNVISIRSQIENTLKQFSTVQSVIISINGRTEDILQP